MKNLKQTLTLLQQRSVIELEISVSDESVLNAPKRRAQYTLDELLAVSNYSQPVPLESREWVNAYALGREVI